MTNMTLARYKYLREEDQLEEKVSVTTPDPLVPDTFRAWINNRA